MTFDQHLKAGLDWFEAMETIPTPDQMTTLVASAQVAAAVDSLTEAVQATRYTRTDDGTFSETWLHGQERDR